MHLRRLKSDWESNEFATDRIFALVNKSFTIGAPTTCIIDTTFNRFCRRGCNNRVSKNVYCLQLDSFLRTGRWTPCRIHRDASQPRNFKSKVFISLTRTHLKLMKSKFNDIIRFDFYEDLFRRENTRNIIFMVISLVRHLLFGILYQNKWKFYIKYREMCDQEKIKFTIFSPLPFCIVSFPISITTSFIFLQIILISLTDMIATFWI